MHEKIFLNGSSFFSALLKDIEEAALSIDLETYIFHNDDFGKKVLNYLEKATERGVKVRLLVDGAGTPHWNNTHVRQLEKAGGETRIFHPFPWRLWQWSHSHVRVPSLLKAIYLLLKINSRNHRKTCTIDDKISYIGSFNIDICHLNKDNAGEDWRDTGVRLENTDLAPLRQAFDAAWEHTHIPERIRHIFRHIHTDPILRLNNNRHRRRILYKNLLKRIRRTKERIWITNAYFVPDNFLLKALIEAAWRRVDVRILLPRKSDVLFMPWASATFYTNLLKAGVRIFEYLPSTLHAKTLILDDWYSVGSSNLNHRSLLHDLEIDVNTREDESKRLLEKQFLADLDQSREINFSDFPKKYRRLYQRIIGRLLLYVKYLI